MAKYVYPAKLTDDDGRVMVEFPDIDNCFTEGDNLVEALELAEDALSMMLSDREDKGEAMPNSSGLANIHCENGEVIVLVKADTVAYRRKTSKKAVKKTLTIPAWVNAMAETHGVNYSQLLQDAILQHIGAK